MRARGSGHIYQVSSIGARLGSPGLGAYQASKWAAAGFSSVLASDMRPLGMRVTSLDPGGMQTDMIGASLTMHDFPEAYEQTVRPSFEYLATFGLDVAAHGGTDIAKVVKVIDALYAAEDPPVRLLLGKDAVAGGKRLGDLLAASDGKWAELGQSTSA